MKWDLDSLYSEEEIRKALSQARDALETFSLADSPENILKRFQEIKLSLRDIESYILCRTSQNVHDKKAEQLQAEFLFVDAKLETTDSQMSSHFAKLSEEELGPLLEQPYTHIIQEKIAQMCAKDESLLNDLSIDGFHGWAQLYDALVTSITIEHRGKTLSFGQAENLLSSNNQADRQSIFQKIEQSFKEKAPLFARALNHISGFRITLNKQRGYSHFLEEPLANNRMQKETLDAMWKAIEKQTEPVLKYFAAKKDKLALSKLHFYDLEASIPQKEEKSLSYQDAQTQVLAAFKTVLPTMATFSERAFANNWIEAEDRAGKRPGGFCTDFPQKNESRIFMTYSGTQHNMLTLAHELGHAYHNELTFPLPEILQHFRMNVAETASITAENIVLDHLMDNATEETKQLVLDDKLNRAIMFLTNIRSRFLFEETFYEEREKGYVSEDRLCELMEQAQKKAYHGALDSYHPYFWAAKLHFFFTNSSFYNFPYTFGYLFSNGIYALKDQYPNFEEVYGNLLRESGMMPVEMLAQKHFRVDITTVEFWEKSIAPIISDIEEYACESSQPSLQ